METIKKILTVLIKFVFVLVLFTLTAYIGSFLMIDFLQGLGLNVNEIDLMFFIIGIAVATDAIRNYIYFGGFSE